MSKWKVEHTDCLNGLKKLGSCDVDLIYLDPPFFTQKSHALKTRDRSKQYSFSDEWESLADYLAFLDVRLRECRRVLRETGSLFLHCDRSASHHLRLLLDKVFGQENFQSEIVWSYRRWSNAKKGLLNTHQLIFFYSKTENFKFNQIYTDYSPTTNVDQIFQRRVRDGDGKSCYERDITGAVIKQDSKKGVPLSDVWEIPYLNPKAQERVGYPTQKPIVLLERIIELVTDRGDLVLDPFCGSGTTVVAAHLLDRRGIGFDISEEAIVLAQERLKKPTKSQSQLLNKGKQAYLNQDFHLSESLKELGLLPVQRNRGIDAFASDDNGARPIPIKIQRDDETFEEACSLLIKASRRNDYSPMILVGDRSRNRSESLFAIETERQDLIVVDRLEEVRKVIGKLTSGDSPDYLHKVG